MCIYFLDLKNRVKNIFKTNGARSCPIIKLFPPGLTVPINFSTKTRCKKLSEILVDLESSDFYSELF